MKPSESKLFVKTATSSRSFPPSSNSEIVPTRPPRGIHNSQGVTLHLHRRVTPLCSILQSDPFAQRASFVLMRHWRWSGVWCGVVGGTPKDYLFLLPGSKEQQLYLFRRGVTSGRGIGFSESICFPTAAQSLHVSGNKIGSHIN